MESNNELDDLPLYKKGKEILDVVNYIGKLIPEDDESLQSIRGQMICDAALLAVKVSDAEFSEYYDMKMEAAVIIRKAANDLMFAQPALEMRGFKEAQYFQIIGDLIAEYRLLFLEWVADFDCSTRTPDSWGLFNPWNLLGNFHDDDFDPSDSED